MAPLVHEQGSLSAGVKSRGGREEQASHGRGRDEIPGREKSRKKDSEQEGAYGGRGGLEEQKGPECNWNTGEHCGQPHMLRQNGEVESGLTGCWGHSREFGFYTKCQTGTLPSDWHL